VLPRIVTDFFLHNQPDAPVIRIYSVIKLYMFRVFTLPIITEFSTVHSAESGWNYSSILTAWKQSSKTCMKLTSAECTVENSVMMGREEARNM
jgi:hypothetical protein